MVFMRRLFILIALFALFPSFRASAQECTGVVSTSGTYFQNYSQAEYSPQGFLILHFKINPTMIGASRKIDSDGYLKNDECDYGNQITGFNDTYVDLPRGATDFSVRFSSPTHYDIWNDASSTPLVCNKSYSVAQNGCSQDIPDYPDYYTFGYGSIIKIGTAWHTLLTTFHPIIQNPPPPPVLTDTLPTPAGCEVYAYANSFQNGTLFSNYERAEYAEGPDTGGMKLLRVHYRFKSPFNLGGGWKARLRLHNSTCTPDVNSFPSSTNVSSTPYMRYWSLRFITPTYWEIWNDELERKEACTLCQGIIPISPSPAYVSFMGANTPVSSSFRGTPYPVQEPVVGNSNVIFIPGLQASRLAARSNPFDRLWEPNANNDVEALYLNLDGTSIAPDIFTEGVIDELFGSLGNIYKSFIADMNDLVAEGTINEWKAFPYDWRVDPMDIVEGNVEMSSGHYNMLEEVLHMASTSDTNKVTIIAHSNGGLVAKALIDKLRAEGKAGLVDQLILVASPQLGTPKVVSTLLHGDDLGLIESQFMDQVRQRTIAENMTSAYNMMPSNEYFARVIDPIIEFDPSTDSGQAIPQQLTDWINRYGHAVNTPAELRDFVSGGDGRSEPVNSDVLTPNVLKEAQLAQADTNQVFYDAWQAPANIKVTQIVGWGLDTVRGMRYVARERSVCILDPETSTPIACPMTPYIDHEPIFTEDGDKTVVTPSASAMATSTYFLDLPLANRGPKVNRVHSDILENQNIRDLLEQKIIDATSTPPKFITIVKQTTGPETRLRIRVLSPVSIFIADSLGSQTNLTAENIPNSYYLEFGEGKYVGLDAEDTYTLKLEGLDTGTFTLQIDEISGDQVTGSLIYPNLPVTPETITTMTIVGVTSISALNIDVNGDGVTDVALEPGETIDATDSLKILEQIITNMDIKSGIKKSLIAKINSAEKKLEKDNPNVGNILEALQNEISAQSSKSINQVEAQKLMQIIETIKNSI